MTRWLIRRSMLLAIVMHVIAMGSMAEALRTSVYVCGGWEVPRNPFALSRARADVLTSPASANPLLEYRVGEIEKKISEVRDDVKELRADFTHITEMLIGALLAVVINLAITIITHRRKRTEERIVP